MPELPTLLFTYLRDERGTVTMEYVLWLPILLAWLILSTVLYDAYKSRDDAAKAAYTVADIISRETELSASDIRRLADLQRLLVPRAGNSMFLRLTSFTCTAEADCLEAAVADTSDYAINWSVVPPIAFSDWVDAPDDEKPSVISTLTPETVEALPLMAKGRHDRPRRCKYPVSSDRLMGGHRRAGMGIPCGRLAEARRRYRPR